MSLCDKAVVISTALLWSQSTDAEPVARTPPSSPTQADEPSDDECPDVVRGVDASLVPVSGGATLAFTTTNKERVHDLRLLLREAAATIEYHSKLAALHPELVSGEADVIPAVDISIKEIPAGVQMQFRAEEAADVEHVVAQVRKLVIVWNESECVRNESESVPATASARQSRR